MLWSRAQTGILTTLKRDANKGVEEGESNGKWVCFVFLCLWHSGWYHGEIKAWLKKGAIEKKARVGGRESKERGRLIFFWNVLNLHTACLHHPPAPHQPGLTATSAAAQCKTPVWVLFSSNPLICFSFSTSALFRSTTPEPDYKCLKGKNKQNNNNKKTLRSSLSL